MITITMTAINKKNKLLVLGIYMNSDDEITMPKEFIESLRQIIPGIVFTCQAPEGDRVELHTKYEGTTQISIIQIGEENE